MLNQVVLVGRLTTDPEIKELDTGKKYKLDLRPYLDSSFNALLGVLPSLIQSGERSKKSPIIQMVKV